MNETTFFFNKTGETYTLEVHQNRKVEYKKINLLLSSFSQAIAEYEQWKKQQEQFKNTMP
jgi:hypothetical protein